MTESYPSGDRNLLFGILALQAGAISESQILEAMKQWTFEKTKPLGQILLEQSALTEEQLGLTS